MQDFAYFKGWWIYLTFIVRPNDFADEDDLFRTSCASWKKLVARAASSANKKSKTFMS